MGKEEEENEELRSIEKGRGECPKEEEVIERKREEGNKRGRGWVCDEDRMEGGEGKSTRKMRKGNKNCKR